jgi:hypothetical protein
VKAPGKTSSTEGNVMHPVFFQFVGHLINMLLAHLTVNLRVHSCKVIYVKMSNS